MVISSIMGGSRTFVTNSHVTINDNGGFSILHRDCNQPPKEE